MPRALADTHITHETDLSAFVVEFSACTAMFPESEKTVIPSIRSDHAFWPLCERERSDKNTLGAINRKIAEDPKTMEPAFKVCFRALSFIEANYFKSNKNAAPFPGRHFLF